MIPFSCWQVMRFLQDTCPRGLHDLLPLAMLVGAVPLVRTLVSMLRTLKPGLANVTDLMPSTNGAKRSPGKPKNEPLKKKKKRNLIPHFRFHFIFLCVCVCVKCMHVCVSVLALEEHGENTAAAVPHLLTPTGPSPFLLFNLPSLDSHQMPRIRCASEIFNRHAFDEWSISASS